MTKAEYKPQPLPRGSPGLIGYMKYLAKERVGNKVTMWGIDHQGTGKPITGTSLLYNVLRLSECF